MKWEWLNNGDSFPAGHRKEGQVGITIDFEDGRPEPQNVYAANQSEMFDKVTRMYGNTHLRLAEAKRTPAAPATPAPASSSPLTAEQTIHAVADLDDPAKAAAAVITLIQQETGVDLRANAKRDKEQAETHRMQGEVSAFMEANAEYYPSKRNANLLRDRAFVLAGGEPITVQTFQQAYDELNEDGVFEAAPPSPSDPVTPPTATDPDEPLAPPPARPRVSTGARPSQFQTRPVVTPTGLKFSAAEVEAMAGTDEYSYRYRHEPGFAQACEAALATR